MLAERIKFLRHRGLSPNAVLAALIVEEEGEVHIAALADALDMHVGSVRRLLGELGDLIVRHRSGCSVNRAAWREIPYNNKTLTTPDNLHRVDVIDHEKSQAQGRTQTRPADRADLRSNPRPTVQDSALPAALAQLHRQEIHGASIPEIGRVISLVAAKFLRQEDLPHYPKMVAAAARETHLAYTEGRIVKTPLRFFYGTLRNMVIQRRWPDPNQAQVEEDRDPDAFEEAAVALAVHLAVMRSQILTPGWDARCIRAMRQLCKANPRLTPADFQAALKLKFEEGEGWYWARRLAAGRNLTADLADLINSVGLNRLRQEYPAGYSRIVEA